MQLLRSVLELVSATSPSNEMTDPGPRRILRFSIFEADLNAGELRKHGVKIHLQDQPFRILEMLLERRGEVVTREELRQKLWPGDTFVDFDHGLNKTINKLREALGDSAQTPRFIETLQRRGYRFIAPATDASVGVGQPTVDLAAASRQPLTRRRRSAWAAAGLGLLLVAAGYFGRQHGRTTTSPPAGRIMLAVLPFTDLGGDPGQEYFCDGMTEEMILQLSRLHPERLGVIARSSAMQYKNSKKPADRIGRELGVHYILEGSVRRAADRVRIGAKLIQVSDQTQLWAESYEHDLRNVLALQSGVAQAIANEIQLRLKPEEQLKLARTRPVNPQAYHAYLMGRYSVSKFTQEGLTKGIKYLHQAIAIDPNYAPAYDGLVYYYIIANDWILPPREAMPKAKEAAKRALEIDDSLAEVHASLGIVHFWYDWEWLAAEREFKRAIELNSGSARAHEFYAWYLGAMGRFEEAIEEGKRALELDPLSPEVNTLLGHILYFARRQEQAIEQLSRALDLDRNYWFAHLILGLVHQQRGKLPEAIGEFKEAKRIEDASPEPPGALGQALALSGKRGEAKKIIKELEERSGRSYVPAYQMAKIYVGLREKDEAFAWLEKAYQDRSLFLTWLKVEPEMDSLRSERRFQDLLRRLGLPP